MENKFTEAVLEYAQCNDQYFKVKKITGSVVRLRNLHDLSNEEKRVHSVIFCTEEAVPKEFL